jgi:hypothetical protein
VASLTTIMDALAEQLQDTLCGTANPLIPGLQVDGRLVANPTPPSIDIYPGEPFQEAHSYGPGNNSLFFSVRARVHTGDHEAGQDLLLSMMDPAEPVSVLQAITSDETLGGIVDDLAVVEGPSSFGYFQDPGSTDNRLLGCIWRVQILP